LPLACADAFTCSAVGSWPENLFVLIMGVRLAISISPAPGARPHAYRHGLGAYDEKIDRLEDLTTGFGACGEASELVVASAEELEVSEKAWKSISAILTQIESYLEDAVAREKGDREGPSGQPCMLARMIAESSELAERVGVKDSMLWNFKVSQREQSIS
jgi:hypothetical protein